MLGPFEARTLALEPGAEQAYDEDEWKDALVFVECGELELRCASGRSRRFGPGSILWLSPLALRALKNPGRDPVVLLAVARSPWHDQ